MPMAPRVLLAPFEFPLLKNDTELRQSSDEARNQFIPYFRFTKNSDRINDGVAVFINSLKDSLDANSFRQLLRFLKSSDHKVIIGEEQLEVEGLKKTSFYIVDKTKKNLYEPKDYIFIDEYYGTLTALLKNDYVYQLDNLVAVEAEVDEKRTKKELANSIQKAIESDAVIKQSELIVSKGSLITNQINQKLVSLEDAFSKRQVNFIDGLGSFFGFIILTFLILAALVIYLYFHFPAILNSPKELGFIILWIVIFAFLVFQIEKTPNLSSYMIPFCIAPIVIKTYYEDRLALFVHIVIVLICSFLSSLGYEFTFLQILAGIVTVLLIEETRYWDRFFLSILIIIATYFLGFLGLSMANTNMITAGLDSSVFKWLGINGVLILLAYPFIPLFSRLFGFTSSITLTELADLNKRLLRELSLNAPGTFQHSLQVSNLSEAAADKIGANGLLLKVAALYHDIGKLKNPILFIENQSGGSFNPHDELTYFDSARGIIDHVIEGEKKAIAAKLPTEIIQMIKSHHGTTRVEFFYRKQLQDFPEKEFDHSLFEYPGPKPVTREETILMIADSIEAASKSLKQPTGWDIDQLVDKIVRQKIENSQLSNSKLTFEELVICQSVFKDLLRNINHVRVEYPEVKKDKVGENGEDQINLP